MLDLYKTSVLSQGGIRVDLPMSDYSGIILKNYGNYVGEIREKTANRKRQE